MQKIKAIIAYDGTDFFGWQKQPEAVSICSTLEQAFFEVFGYRINLIGASRTDTGVHALNQVAMFHSDLNRLDLNVIQSAWNNHLPKSILIRDLQLVPENFHACFNVVQKTYYYHLFLKCPLPMVSRYGWLYKFIDQVDLAKFESALNLYTGEHDFGSFCKVDEDSKNTVRTIDSIKLERFGRFGVLRVTIKGPGFLRFQIRRMIGYALDVARRDDLSVNYIKALLDNPDPKQTLIKAEASGLCLRKVVYKK
jgi:tRNA pseudouridine38-40 synthase